MPGSVIVAGARTPIGKLSGALAGFPATDLGGFAIKAALERAGVAPDQVDYVFMGQVLQAGAGQIPARQAAVKAGIPMSVPSTTINKVCLSGLNTIHLADLLIQAGRGRHRRGRRHGVDDQGAVPAARRPRRLPDRRQDGRRLDDVRRPVLRLRRGAPWAPAPRSTRGLGGHRPASAQDEFAAQSPRAGGRGHQGRAVRRRDRHRRRSPSARATRSWSTPTRACAPARPPRRLGGLRPAFDGRRQHHRRQRVADLRRRRRPSIVTVARPRPSASASTPLAEIVGYGQVAGPDAVAADPAVAGDPARPLERAGTSVGDVDLFELNEAFAAVGLASMAELGISDEVTNVNGGAIALGHPIGMSRHPAGAHPAPRAAPPGWRHSVPPPCAAAAARATPSSLRTLG